MTGEVVKEGRGSEKGTEGEVREGEDEYERMGGKASEMLDGRIGREKKGEGEAEGGSESEREKEGRAKLN